MLFGFEDPVEAGLQAETLPEIDGDPSDSSPGPGSRSWIFGVIGLLAGLTIAFGLWAIWPEPTDQLTPADVDQAIDDALVAHADAAVATAVYEQIAPSIVVVRANDEDPDVAAKVGGGVVINDRGQILTASHVVADASSIDLLFADGTAATAQVFADQPQLDIAVLTASGSSSTLVPAVVGNSRTLRVGDPIFAVGNPLGLTGSMTAGVISGLGRDIPFPGDEESTFEDLIQFDAAVNQGSSGGPLVNAEGQVVGIVTALANPADQGFFIGIGFAVPIDIAAGGAADGPSQ